MVVGQVHARNHIVATLILKLLLFFTISANMSVHHKPTGSLLKNVTNNKSCQICISDKKIPGGQNENYVELKNVKDVFF